MLYATMTVSWLAIPARKTSAFVVVWFRNFLPATHSIKEVKPDDWDLQMLNEIEANSECHEFVSEGNAMKKLGLS